MSKTRVYEWYKHFQEGHEDVDNDKWPGCSSNTRTDDDIEKRNKWLWTFDGSQSQNSSSVCMKQSEKVPGFCGETIHGLAPQ